MISLMVALREVVQPDCVVTILKNIKLLFLVDYFISPVGPGWS